jgi:hypothetical protein
MASLLGGVRTVGGWYAITSAVGLQFLSDAETAAIVENISVCMTATRNAQRLFLCDSSSATILGAEN